MAAGIRQRPDDLVQLEERARPAVGDTSGSGSGPDAATCTQWTSGPPTSAGTCGNSLSVALLRPPVESVGPVLAQRRAAIRRRCRSPSRPRDRLGPPSCGEPGVQVVELGIGDVHGKRADPGVIHAVHLPTLGFGRVRRSEHQVHEQRQRNRQHDRHEDHQQAPDRAAERTHLHVSEPHTHCVPRTRHSVPRVRIASPRRSGQGVRVGFYEDQVLPRAINAMLGNRECAKLRARAVAGLEGDVLEIGFGSGLNMPIYPETVARVLAVDPATVGRQLAADRVAASPIPVEYIGLDGESLPLPDESVDHA